MRDLLETARRSYFDAAAGASSRAARARKSPVSNAGSEQRPFAQANAAGRSRSGNPTSELGSGPSRRSQSSTRLYEDGNASAATRSALVRESWRGPTTVKCAGSDARSESARSTDPVENRRATSGTARNAIARSESFRSDSRPV